MSSGAAEAANSRLRYLPAVGLAGVIILGPVAIGCVHIVTSSVMQFLVFSLLLIAIWSGGWSCQGEELSRRYTTRTLFLACPYLLFLMVGFFQMIPLPAGLVEKVSPNVAALYSQAEAEIGPVIGVESSFWPLTVSLSATSSELLRWTAHIAAFLLAATPLPTRGGKRLFIRNFLIIFFAVGLLEAIYGLSLYVSGSENLFWFKRSHSADGVSGTYINRNHFAGLMGMCIPISAALLASQRLPGTTGRRLGFRQYLLDPISFRAWACSYVLLGGMVVMILALTFSMSRMGQFSVAVAIVFAAALYAMSKIWGKGGRTRFLILVLLAAIGLGLLWGVWKGLEPVERRWQALEGSYEERSAIWSSTINLIKDFPVIGVGLGGYSLSYPPYKSDRHNGITVDHAHNDYLELLSEVGIAGFIPWLSFLLLFLALSTRAWTICPSSSARLLAGGCLCGTVAILVHSLADFNLHIPGNATLLFVIMGFVWRLLNMPHEMAVGGGDALA